MAINMKFLVIFSLFLAACGYKPLYTAIQEDMSKVTVGEVKMKKVTHKVGERRVSQVVHKKLAQSLNGDGSYKVDVAITESVSTLAVRRDATDQRLELNLTGDVRVYDEVGQVVFKTDLTSSVAYNVEDTPFATDAGKERAKTAAAIALSDEILRTITLFFRQNSLKSG
jgi:hypothetical protein